jgi:hypothetical protein
MNSITGPTTSQVTPEWTNSGSASASNSAAGAQNWSKVQAEAPKFGGGHVDSGQGDSSDARVGPAVIVSLSGAAPTHVADAAQGDPDHDGF